MAPQQLASTVVATTSPYTGPAVESIDEVIERLTMDIHTNELQLKRLKKRKLMLKDQITRMESQLIPDLNA